jgi:arylsulfatase A-like enzyme
MDALSFADVARDANATGPGAAFSEHGLKSAIPQYLVRTEQYKYVYNDGGSCHELYDLKNDPGEMVNLINNLDCTSVRDDLKDRLFAWYNPETNPYRRR